MKDINIKPIEKLDNLILSFEFSEKKKGSLYIAVFLGFKKTVNAQKKVETFLCYAFKRTDRESLDQGVKTAFHNKNKTFSMLISKDGSFNIEKHSDFSFIHLLRD